VGSEKDSAQKTIDTIRRKTRRKHSEEEKIRIVIEGLKGEERIALRTPRQSPVCGDAGSDGRV
jgi:hypothetical protein